MIVYNNKSSHTVSTNLKREPWNIRKTRNMREELGGAKFSI